MITETQISNAEFVITRTFDAPRVLVWQAWTDANHLAKWWGPAVFENEVVSFDFRPGGVFHYKMTTPNGEMWGRFVYREINEPEKLVYVSSFSDEAGEITRAPFADNFPLEVLSTLELEENNGQTTLTLRGIPINASADEMEFFASMHSSMQGGWNGTMDQLAAHLARQK
jgi:uncharacterized protein YndB with AHSA1/START domain